MISIYKKEMQLFFSSVIGYIVVGLFIALTGMFLWVFRDTSILYTPFAVLDQLFFMTPYVFLFLIPALTMKSFADEFQKGTIELLFTKPLSLWQVLMGKYLAYLTLVAIMIIFSLINYYSLHQLASPVGAIDHGSIIGSYLGMLLLGAAFVAIGIFSSSMCSNQVTAFLVAIGISFAFYWGFYYLSGLPLFTAGADILLEKLGMEYHYSSISRGVVDNRDVSYFIFIIVLFISSSYIILNSRK